MKHDFSQHSMWFTETVHYNLDGYFVLGEGSAPKQLIDAMNGEETRDVGT